MTKAPTEGLKWYLRLLDERNALDDDSEYNQKEKEHRKWVIDIEMFEAWKEMSWPERDQYQKPPVD